jgi:hypothetical protein
MSVKALVELRDAIVSARDSDHLPRFPGRFNPLTFIRLCFTPVATVAAENLFLRKQLGLYIERKTRARKATDAIRFTLAQLSRLFAGGTLSPSSNPTR